MIKINDDFEFDRYMTYGWRLHHWRDGVDPKTKLPSRSARVTYHATLLHVCDAIIDRSAGTANSINEVIAAINTASARCQTAILRMESEKGINQQLSEDLCQ